MGWHAAPEHLSCHACPLAYSRTQVVPGHGNRTAHIVIVGEAPGAVEDRVGEPFVGKAGVKLNQLLERAGLDRSALFLDNVVHCRPPQNNIRAQPQALTICPELWLKPTLEEIKPCVVVAMGATAGSLWFPGKEVHDIADLQRVLKNGIMVIGSYHPSYALREGAKVEESIVSSLIRARELAQ